ncbi:MAG: methionine--tRNA ligase [Vicingaceae bacterium]
MEHKKRYTVTAALPYANGPLHIGHIAGAYLPADIYVRFLKATGNDVAFICGSDEHGAAITLRAKKEGKTPQEIVDQNHAVIKKAFEDFGINFSIYHRTSSGIHKQTAQDFFRTLNNKGAFIKKTTEQFYDEEHQQFLADRYITGTCPKCDYPEAYGDQCEKCGSSLSPTELKNPISILSGKPPVLKSTSHWFLPMQNHETWLKEWIEKGILDGKLHHQPNEWRKPVLGQCKSWLDNGLHERSITRDLDWGVPVPKEIEGSEGKVLYVWFDAPIGYISATKEWAKQNNKKWEDYWQNEATQLIHFIGKDNIVFHCIIFPILLKEHGQYNLPVNVPANEFLNLEGDKISTSRNWAVWLHEYLEDFPNKQDELRYVLTAIAPETKDSEFTWADYQSRVNNELVAILGNFINRAVVLTHKYYNGIIPSLNDISENSKKAIDEAYNQTSLHIKNFQFREALASAIQLARYGNKYLADNEPWSLYKQGKEAATKQILFESLQIAAHLAYVIYPFLPHTSQKILDLLSINDKEITWEVKNQYCLLKANHSINKATLLFEKIEDEQIQKQIEKLEKNKQQKSKLSPMKTTITYDDFSKLDIRVGTILSAEKHPNADKLLKFTVDTGLDKRTILSGIAEQFKPEDLVGKQVSVIVNLAPRKIRGIESQGMILMAENPEEKLTFVAPETFIENGSVVR